MTEEMNREDINLEEFDNVVNDNYSDKSMYEMLKETAINDTNANEEPTVADEMENYFNSTLQDYEDFDERAYNKGDGYKIPGFPLMENNLEGVESGLYVFAGESNSGKSALMMNVLKDMVSYRPNKLFGVYYSLDDSKHEIIPRIIAMEQEIPISVASKPKRYENMIEQCDNDNIVIYQEYLDKRQEGLDKLREEVDIFKIEDANKIKNTTDLKEHIKNIRKYVKSIDPEMNVMIAVDALNDVFLDKKVYGKVTDKGEIVAEVSKFLKDLSVEFDMIVFTSSHLRKLNGNRRPTVDDLKEANTLLYEASVVWLVYNDVSKNKGAATIYWDDKNADGGIGAVIEIDWGKNKKSSYKGRTFCAFKPYFSKTIELDKNRGKFFEGKILQAN